MTGDEMVAAGEVALGGGRWDDARRSFEQALAEVETAPGCFGLGVALWWTGHNREAVEQCTRAYALFRRGGDVEHAVQCAVWLAITYKANFANTSAANGWSLRAERLAGGLAPGALHGWTRVARAYRAVDLDRAASLTTEALTIARDAGDVDLELVACSQLGLIRVGLGDVSSGFALIDEALAASLAGERTSLDTVVYTCCDMLNACELADDMVRARHWCAVADDFVGRYGCPFLYAECRIYYGSVLVGRGRWEHAERELLTGLRITEATCPALHARALTRLAGLRVRQGRLEDARRLLALVDEVPADPESILAEASLLLASGDATAAVRTLTRRPDVAGPVARLASGLGLLVDANLAAHDVPAAATAAERLSTLAGAGGEGSVAPLAARARGMVAGATGDVAAGAAELTGALEAWAALEQPLEVARARVELARLLAPSAPDAAIDHARRALGTFESLGAAIDADRTAALLRSLGVVARVGAKGGRPLTDREEEVLRLIAVGLSNPQIAERLHVSRKTAAHHVSSILAKLHVPNRAAAAAYAATRDVR